LSMTVLVIYFLALYLLRAYIGRHFSFTLHKREN
jgi:hypothetical protein